MIIKEGPLDRQPDISGINALALLQDMTSGNIIDKLLFFDIETTGFAAKNTICYMIGCVYFKDSEWHYIQWFADNQADELLVIWKFFEYAKNYLYLIHFNGDGFDIPYILEKCKLFKLPYNFSQFISIDIYQCARAVKELLKLENHKQKTIEHFLGIDRDDKYTGGELINVYNSLNKSDCDAATRQSMCDLLLLHNHDDICALPQLTTMLSYMCISCGDNSSLSHRINETVDYNGEPVQEIIFTYELPVYVPTPVSYGAEPYYIRISDNHARVRVRMFEGEYRHYYANYKDYYYLTKEDKAIHKSVAAFVDKAYREPAKAANCYVRKKGTFLPQNHEIETPLFKSDIKDKQTYFELNDIFLNNNTSMTAYINDILISLLPSYRKIAYHSCNQDHDS